MRKLVVSPASLHDLQEIAGRLRAEDIEEIRAATRKTPLESLVGGFGLGDSFVARLEEDGVLGAPAVVFGVSPHPFYGEHGVGIVWLLATDEVNKVSKLVVREARKMLTGWRKEWKLLGNYADIRNKQHLKWIQLMGFEFIETKDINGFEFQGFVMYGDRYV